MTSSSPSRLDRNQAASPIAGAVLRDCGSQSSVTDSGSRPMAESWRRISPSWSAWVTTMILSAGTFGASLATVS